MSLKKHIITGGPCSGKTTTVQALKEKGFGIVEEASRILIEEQTRSGGDLVPWKKLHEFNVAVTELQVKLEAEAKDGTHFLDRGVVDNLAYCEWGGIKPPENLQAAVKDSTYHKVFLLQQLNHFENDEVRKESPEDAVRLQGLVKKAYESQGYQVIEVPPWPVEKRVEFILGHVSVSE